MDQSTDILENISTGIIAMDAQLVVTGINSAAQALLEVSAARTIGLNAAQLVLRPGEWLHNLEQSLLGNAPLTQRGLPLILHNGHEIHVDLTANPVPDGAGGTALLVELQAIDRLLKISREEGMLHAQQTTKAVIRSLAHEIKNPLGGIRGSAQLLEQELENPALQEYTQVIIQESDRLRSLMENLLTPQAGSHTSVLNIHEVLERVRSVVLAEVPVGLAVKRDYDTSLPALVGDKEQLIQVMLNIVRNAAQAMPETGGKIKLTTSQEGGFVKIVIRDTGSGISPENLKKIFDPFFSTKSKGTGLGLAAVKRIIERHKGTIEAESELGKGTAFIIYPSLIYLF